MRLPLDTANVRAARMLVAGRVTITFTSPSGSHITILAKCRMPDQSGQWVACSLDRAKVINFEVPNSTGWNDRVGKYTQSKGFVPAPNADPARVYCAQALLAYVAGQPVNPNLTIQEANNCGRCGRELTDPESIALGIGPTCRGSEETSSHHQVKVQPEDQERTYQDIFDLALARKFDTLTDDDLDTLIRSTETARGKFAGNRLYVNKAAKSERDRRRQIVEVPPRPTTDEEIAELPILDPVILTDKKGRELPRTFDELAARVRS